MGLGPASGHDAILADPETDPKGSLGYLYQGLSHMPLVAGGRQLLSNHHYNHIPPYL